MNVELALQFLGVFATPVAFAATIIWYRQNSSIANSMLELQALKTCLKQAEERLEEARKKPQQTEELTEFLRDFKNHGYSFVRVDPDSVIMRSPKEL